MKVMRADYNKPWRCPGWSGRHPAICNNGSLARYYSADSYKWARLYKPHWTMYTCPECGTHVLPFILRWLEPSELLRILKWKIRDWKYDRKLRTMSQKSEACQSGEHDDCDRLAWIAGWKDALYCLCDCGCDGIGQEWNV